MNRYIIPLLILAISIGTASCQQVDMQPKQESELSPEEVTALPSSSLNSTYIDIIRVCFTSEIADRIEQSLAKEGLRSLDDECADLLDKMGAINLRRVFSHGGKYEARHRREGLHQWYDIILAPSTTIREARKLQERALAYADEHTSIEITELVYEARLPEYKAIPLTLDEPDIERLRGSNTSSFNDTKLPLQWHYNNDGRFIRSVSHADINLFEAWKIETGKPEVIVSVVDGGIDHHHEDLRDNMYINQAELKGVKGVDDDNNGYIDDIYGYDFANNRGKITPYDHGTHVAGTVAARNNNGIGVCGVAGGDGKPNSGIRLMSCEIFSYNDNGKEISGGFEDAIVYGADNGAVISQNSWSIPNSSYISASLKVAIDYFIKHAGCDENSNQLPNSPMKGGIVIFAAGNEGREYMAVPAAYDKIVAVSSMSFDFTVAPYSNYGTWVDIMAPGGNIYDHKGQVLSTLPDNQYGYMQGTSMACPHVSGVAALMVSKFGGPGFTADQLREKLLYATRKEDINARNPRHMGRLGNGYIDAAVALSKPKDAAEHKAPEKPVITKVTTTQTKIELHWQVSKDLDDIKASSYRIYYSPTPINGDFSNLDYILSSSAEAAVGEEITFTLSIEAAPKSTFYLALVAIDRWGNMSEATYTTATTKENASPTPTLPIDIHGVVISNATTSDLQQKPTITTPPLLRLSKSHSKQIEIVVTDPEQNKWHCEIIGSNYGSSIDAVKDGKINLTLKALTAPGDYTLTLAIIDEHKGITLVHIPFEAYQNEAPVRTKLFEQQTLVMGGSNALLDLDQYFGDINGDLLTYTIKKVGKSTVFCSIDDSKLTIKPIEIGLSGFIITATDPLGAQVSSSLEVRVSSDDLLQVLYPNPVEKQLNLRLLSNAHSVTLKIRSTMGTTLINHIHEMSKGTNLSLDVSKVPSGVYRIEANDGYKSSIQTFVKR